MMPFPDEDSPDVTEEDAAGAVRAGSLRDVGQLIHLCCDVCGSTPMSFVRHQRRRRKPYHYSRVTLRCGGGHEVKRLVHLTWMDNVNH